MKGLPQLPKTPGVPPLPRLDTRLPQVPDVADLVDQPALGDLEATTQEEFNKRFQAWGSGSVEEFRAYDFLSGRLHLQPSQDFYFLPGQSSGSSSKFYISDMVWRINGLHPQNAASGKMERMSLQGNGWKVVDLDIQDLQAGNAEGTLWAAIRGQEPHAAVEDQRPPQPIVEAINRAALG